MSSSALSAKRCSRTSSGTTRGSSPRTSCSSSNGTSRCSSSSRRSPRSLRLRQASADRARRSVAWPGVPPPPRGHVHAAGLSVCAERGEQHIVGAQHDRTSGRGIRANRVVGEGAVPARRCRHQHRRRRHVAGDDDRCSDCGAGRFTARAGELFERVRLVATAAAMVAVFGVTIKWGVDSRDDLLWKHELIASFLRPEGFAFEPTARREAVAERDAVLRASYPRPVAGARRKNVVLIIVDSLRADRMQVYGYQRETTPFLSALVQSGRMKKVEAAFRAARNRSAGSPARCRAATSATSARAPSSCRMSCVTRATARGSCSPAITAPGTACPTSITRKRTRSSTGHTRSATPWTMTGWCSKGSSACRRRCLVSRRSSTCT